MITVILALLFFRLLPGARRLGTLYDHPLPAQSLGYVQHHQHATVLQRSATHFYLPCRYVVEGEEERERGEEERGYQREIQRKRLCVPHSSLIMKKKKNLLIIVPKLCLLIQTFFFWSELQVGETTLAVAWQTTFLLIVWVCAVVPHQHSTNPWLSVSLDCPSSKPACKVGLVWAF